MGQLVKDEVVPVIQAELNRRFASGDPIAEMVALQKEFGIFAPKHTLTSAARLLDLMPQDAKDRRGWLRFLGNLKRVRSDVSGQNGHDRIRSALKANLEAKAPKPVFFSWHPASQDPRVTVTTDAAFSFSSRRYLIVSAPLGGSPKAS
jgi:hypothetical protein